MTELEVLRTLLKYAVPLRTMPKELGEAITWAKAYLRRAERPGLRRVVLESPYSGEVAENRLYALRALRDSLQRGEAPLASHLLYPQALAKYDQKDRLRGMVAGWEWTRVAAACVVYADLGVTAGMKKGIDVARREDVPVEERQILKVDTGHGC